MCADPLLAEQIQVHCQTLQEEQAHWRHEQEEVDAAELVRLMVEEEVVAKAANKAQKAEEARKAKEEQEAKAVAEWAVAEECQKCKVVVLVQAAALACKKAEQVVRSQMEQPADVEMQEPAMEAEVQEIEPPVAALEKKMWVILQCKVVHGVLCQKCHEHGIKCFCQVGVCALACQACAAWKSKCELSELMTAVKELESKSEATSASCKKQRTGMVMVVDGPVTGPSRAH